MLGLLGGRYASFIHLAIYSALVGGILVMALLYRAERRESLALTGLLAQAAQAAKAQADASDMAAKDARDYAERTVRKYRKVVAGAKGDTACAVFADGWRLLAEGDSGEAR